MAEVFEVTRAQLAEWEDNWQVFSYDEKSRDEGSRWLMASIGIGYSGRPFQVTAWADGTAQDRESACAVADDYNATNLEDMTLDGTPGDLECEVWHVVDAIPAGDDYAITGARLREIEELADKLIYLFTKETGISDLSFYRGADGRLWGSTDHNEGYLLAAQQLRDIVADVARTPLQNTAD